MSTYMRQPPPLQCTNAFVRLLTSKPGRQRQRRLLDTRATTVTEATLQQRRYTSDSKPKFKEEFKSEWSRPVDSSSKTVAVAVKYHGETQLKLHRTDISIPDRPTPLPLVRDGKVVFWKLRGPGYVNVPQLKVDGGTESMATPGPLIPKEIRTSIESKVHAPNRTGPSWPQDMVAGPKADKAQRTLAWQARMRAQAALDKDLGVATSYPLPRSRQPKSITAVIGADKRSTRSSRSRIVSGFENHESLKSGFSRPHPSPQPSSKTMLPSSRQRSRPFAPLVCRSSVTTSLKSVQIGRCRDGPLHLQPGRKLPHIAQVLEINEGEENALEFANDNGNDQAYFDTGAQGPRPLSSELMRRKRIANYRIADSRIIGKTKIAIPRDVDKGRQYVPVAPGTKIPTLPGDDLRTIFNDFTHSNSLTTPVCTIKVRYMKPFLPNTVTRKTPPFVRLGRISKARQEAQKNLLNELNNKLTMVSEASVLRDDGAIERLKKEIEPLMDIAKRMLELESATNEARGLWGGPPLPERLKERRPYLKKTPKERSAITAKMEEYMERIKLTADWEAKARLIIAEAKEQRKINKQGRDQLTNSEISHDADIGDGNEAERATASANDENTDREDEREKQMYLSTHPSIPYRVQYIVGKKEVSPLAVHRYLVKRKFADACHKVFREYARPGYDYLIFAKRSALMTHQQDIIDILKDALSSPRLYGFIQPKPGPLEKFEHDEIEAHKKSLWTTHQSDGSLLAKKEQPDQDLRWDPDNVENIEAEKKEAEKRYLESVTQEQLDFASRRADRQATGERRTRNMSQRIFTLQALGSDRRGASMIKIPRHFIQQRHHLKTVSHDFGLEYLDYYAARQGYLPGGKDDEVIAERLKRRNRIWRVMTKRAKAFRKRKQLRRSEN